MAVPAMTGVLLLLAATTVQISSADALAGAAGVDLCAATGPVHLPTPSSQSSLQLGLAASPGPQGAPCRLDVTVPPSYELAVTLVPAPAAPEPELPEEGDDAYDYSRTSRIMAALLEQTGGGTKKYTNYGGMIVEAVIEDVGRKGSNANASCTLALYINGEVAWSADLCDEDSVKQGPQPHISSFPHNLSLTWTPPQDGRALRVASVALTAVRKGLPTDNFCTASPVRLAGRGLESAIALELRDDRRAEDRVGPCRVPVLAPPGYQLSLVLVNKATTAAAASPSSAQDAASDEVPVGDPSCRLSLIPGCSVLFSVDLCQPAAAASLNYSEWSPNNVTLEWTPPHESQRGAQVANTVILTAVARGAMCQHAHFAPCQHRPRFQHFCVAAELACDGHPNCPMDGRDEDPSLCRASAGLIEVPRSVPDRASVVNAGVNDAGDVIRDLLRTLGSNRTENQQADAIPDTLSNYGPWGYLMLGMLVCGAFLMLCGLWECCCRQPKASATTIATQHLHTPTTVLMPQMGATGGVLGMDSDLEDDPSRPPAYDDLDQPPAYGALFPPGVLRGQPKDDVILPVATLEASLSASLDAPFDANSLSASTSSMASSTTSSMATASSGSSMSLS